MFLRLIHSSLWRWGERLRLAIAVLVVAILPIPVVAQVYQYDSASRLIGVVYATDSSIAYTYDAAGNLLTVSSGGSGSRLPTIVTPPQAMAVTAGSTVTLTVTATGTGLSYQWEKNGTPITGATDATLVISAVQTSNAGSYSVVITNTAGSVTSTAAVLSVSPAQPSAYLETWSLVTGTPLTELPSATSYDGVAFDGSQFMAVGADGSVYTSSAGAAWTNVTPAPPPWSQLNSVVYIASLNAFMAVGNLGRVGIMSAPSFTPSLPADVTGNVLTGLAVGPSQIVAVGYSGTIISANSQGVGWGLASSSIGTNLNAVTFGDGLFVAVGLGGTVLTSPNGTTWTARPLGATTDLYGVAYGGGIFAAVGVNGAIYVSPDGSNWSATTSPTTNTLVRIAYANGAFVIVGVTGTIVTSGDGGATWISQNSGTTIRLNGIAFGQGYFLAVGDQGTVVRSSAAPPPVFSSEPSPATIATGSTVVFSAAANGTTSPTYQWYLNGAAIAGATSSQLLITGATTSNAGTYTCVATDGGGAITSSQAVLTVVNTTNPGRLVNLSMLSDIKGNLSMGFVNGGTGTSGPETLLIRAIGPSIGTGTAFNVPGVMEDPTLTVMQQNPSSLIAGNSGWGTPAGNAGAVMAADNTTGAFALTDTSSLDSALVLSLPPITGGYSAIVAGQTGNSGYALTEVYDDTANYTTASTRLINLSCLTTIASGGTIDVGFVIDGSTSKTVLIRVGGPILNTLYGITGVMPDPQLQISPLSSSSTVLASNAGWDGNSQIAGVANSVGAYGWPTNPVGADSAAVVTLVPGTYTVQVNGVSGDGGIVLVEIYDVP